MMTRKDYVLIAEAVAEAIGDMVDHPARVAGGHQVARSLARSLCTTNPLFDRERFLTACGVSV